MGFELKESREKSGYLREAYKLVHGEEVGELLDWQVAERILEVLDNQAWVPQELAEDCIYEIVQMTDYPDLDTTRRIVGTAEEAARKVFPELAKIDEVHMDQIEHAYMRALERRKNNNHTL